MVARSSASPVSRATASAAATTPGQDHRRPPGRCASVGRHRWRGGHRRPARGPDLVPEDRLGTGPVPGLSPTDNMLLTRRRARFFVNRRAAAPSSAETIEQFEIRPRALRRRPASSPAATPRRCSSRGRSPTRPGRRRPGPHRLLADARPDIGAAEFVRGSLHQVRVDGGAVLVISEDLDEVRSPPTASSSCTGARSSSGASEESPSNRSVWQWRESRNEPADPARTPYAPALVVLSSLRPARSSRPCASGGLPRGQGFDPVAVYRRSSRRASPAFTASPTASPWRRRSS